MVEDKKTGALLTPSQREYLKGESNVDPDSSHARTIKSRIRSRIREGVLDATLIMGNFPVEDIQKALEIREVPQERGDPGDLVIETGTSHLIGLVYLANIDKEELVYAEKGDVASHGIGIPLPSSSWIRQLDEGWYFERRAEKGIRQALNRRGVSAERVDVTVEIDRGEEFADLSDRDTDELAERSETTLSQAMMAGEITSEQFADAIKAKGRDIESPEEESEADEE